MKNFKDYHKENPQIWEAFKKYSFEAKKRGFKNYSAYSIFELVRWYTETRAKGKYKLNNNFRPDYARKMMAEFTDFEGFFRVRELKAKRT